MNTNIYNRNSYITLQLSLGSNENKDSCCKLLTNIKNNSLCLSIYDDNFIKAAIEQSNYVLLRHIAGDPSTVVAFALVQIKRTSKTNKMDILLVCAIPNKERFGQMIAYDLYRFALKKGCKKIYTSPRTSDLRRTFVKYGFRHHLGIENYTEVLVKDVHVQVLEKIQKTLKRRTKQNTETIQKTLKRRTKRNTETMNL